MKRWNIYTPDGVQDILFENCKKKRELESNIRRLFAQCGYAELETPSMEFYDVFNGDNALLPQEKMFKFTDAKGRLLVLKPDMTIPVARVAATKIKDGILPIKCCYIGNTFSSDEIGGGRQNEFTQAGVEVMGISGPDADAEVLAMAVRAVLASGIREFQVDVGQVEFFRGIMEESGLTKKEIEEVRELIDVKDFVGVEQVMDRHAVSDELKALILDLPKLFGAKDILSRIPINTIGVKARNALDNLKSILDIMDDLGLSEYVSVDLGMVQSMNYYTGMVFRGYTYGVGFPILSGGRYDTLVSRFGCDLPATGFSLGVNMILMAMERQGLVPEQDGEPEEGTLVIYETGARRQAAQLCDQLRAQDIAAELDIRGMLLEDAISYAQAKGYNRVIQLAQNGKTTATFVPDKGGLT